MCGVQNGDCSDCRQSAPHCQLYRRGSDLSYHVLRRVAQAMPAADLASLEEELTYFAKTGLVGVHMSNVLVALGSERNDAAA